MSSTFETRTRCWSRVAGCLYLSIAAMILLSASFAAAVSIDAVAMLTPWFVATVGIGCLLWLGRSLRSVLIASVVVGSLSAAFWIAGFATSSQAFYAGLVSLTALSIAAVLTALVGLMRLGPPRIRNRESDASSAGR